MQLLLLLDASSFLPPLTLARTHTHTHEKQQGEALDIDEGRVEWEPSGKSTPSFFSYVCTYEPSKGGRALIVQKPKPMEEE